MGKVVAVIIVLVIIGWALGSCDTSTTTTPNYSEYETITPEDVENAPTPEAAEEAYDEAIKRIDDWEEDVVEGDWRDPDF